MAQVLLSDSFKLGLVIAVTLVSSSWSAPTTPPSTNPWWYNPCGENVHRMRHSRSATNDPLIRSQLKLFLSTLSINNKSLRFLYIKHMGNYQNMKFKWLKINALLGNITRQNDANHTEFYKVLQRFAGTLETFRSVQIKDDIPFNFSARNIVYKNVKDALKALMCEVCDSIKNKNIALPTVPLKKMGIKIKKDKGKLSLTHARTLDLNFFKKLTTFFKKYQKYQRKMNRKRNKNNVNSAKLNRTRGGARRQNL